jgi:hypothetical protein
MKHCRNSDVQNEVTFQIKNLSCTYEGKHTIVQKLVPVVQVVFPGCLLEGGGVGAAVCYVSVECSVISGYVLKTP